MSDAPQASLIIRTHNEERWIGYCLQSVLRQADVDFEVLLVDDGSTDKTLEIIDSIQDDRIRLVYYDEDYLPGRSLKFWLSSCAR